MDYVTDWAAKWALYKPSTIALKDLDTGESLTYAALQQQSTRLAHWLNTKYDIKKGDRIALLAENNLLYPLLFCAAQKLGCILVPINYRLAAREVAYIVSDCDPQLMICESQFDTLTDAIDQTIKIEEWAIFYEQFKSLKITTSISTQAAPNLSPEDPIFILYTSGTTGLPKGAIYTHKMLFWNSVNTTLSLSITTESRTLNVMPPFHTGGWNVLTTPFLHRGAYTAMARKFDPDIILQQLVKESVTIFMAVPTMLKMLTESSLFSTIDFSHLDFILTGGESVTVAQIEKWSAAGVPIRQGYGMTEVGPNLTSLHQDDALRKKGSIGRPNFYVQARIVDEAGEDCPPHTTGELWLRGPMVTPGYWRNKEATQKAFRGDWFATGDLMQKDEEAYYYVVGRKKDMFISGAENVYPAEIEAFLVTHPHISEAAVIGVPHEKWGEVGKAFLVLDNNDIIDAESLKLFCRTGLAKFKIPKSFIFLTELPKNGTGKIDRKKLRLQYANINPMD